MIKYITDRIKAPKICYSPLLWNDLKGNEMGRGGKGNGEGIEDRWNEKEKGN
jgi:hypothetical protein